MVTVVGGADASIRRIVDLVADETTKQRILAVDLDRQSVLMPVGAALCRAQTLSLAVTCRCGCGQAARWYSLRTPPRMRRRRTASLISTTTSGSWSGGR